MRTLRLALAGLAGLPLLYLLAALAGAVPVGGGRSAGPGHDGTGLVAVFVVSNGVHLDILVPMRSPVRDWTETLRPEHFPRGNPLFAAYAGFGWGDRSFYLNTPTWSALTPGDALRALFASAGSLVHVSLWYGTPEPGPGVRRLLLGEDAYRRLLAALDAGFQHDEAGRPRLIPGRSYGLDDAFFEGEGHYSVLETCNEWAASRLRAAGVPGGWWSPLPFGVLWNL